MWRNADLRAEALRRVGRTLTGDERSRHLHSGERTEAMTANR